MLNLLDRRSIEKKKPLLIAHRGGVISPDSPENSLAAIRLAAKRGYHMVELDVREAQDHVPMLYHGFAGHGHLYVDCGIDQNLEELTSAELSSITYRLSDQSIPKLAEALELCANLQLGVMLDIKAPTPTDAFLQHISELLTRNGLEASTVTLGVSQQTEAALLGKVIFPVQEPDVLRMMEGEALNLGQSYYFDWGSKITGEAVRVVQERGAFVIAAINTFHYPRHAKNALAREDIQRLIIAGVDGFQIDNEFEEIIYQSTHARYG